MEIAGKDSIIPDPRGLLIIHLDQYLSYPLLNQTPQFTSTGEQIQWSTAVHLFHYQRHLCDVHFVQLWCTKQVY